MTFRYLIVDADALDDDDVFVTVSEGTLCYVTHGDEPVVQLLAESVDGSVVEFPAPDLFVDWDCEPE